MEAILSILLGLIPETLFFTLFLIYTKNLKEKKLKLFILINIAYIMCVMISQYKILYYVALIFLIYLALKMLYKDKAQISDIFIINLADLYICITSFICFLFVKEDFSNYYLLAVIQKILLFVPFIFRTKFYDLYKKYYSLWNRNYEKKQPVKSITIRNFSLILLNLSIFIFNLIILYVISNIK